jgi:hypothetical protein
MIQSYNHRNREARLAYQRTYDRDTVHKAAKVKRLRRYRHTRPYGENRLRHGHGGRGAMTESGASKIGW